MSMQRGSRSPFSIADLPRRFWRPLNVCASAVFLKSEYWAQTYLVSWEYRREPFLRSASGLSPRCWAKSDPLVFEAIGLAFGHLHERRAIPLLAPLSKHQDNDVRLGVVKGLLNHPDATAIATLIELTKDEDEDVRNWATFGLGSQTDLDTAEIRAALL